VRILFDHNTPRPLKLHLDDKHSITLAYELAWDTKTNGDLISSAEVDGFDLLITTDQSIRYQQNLAARNIAIIVLMPNNWHKILPHVDKVREAVENAVANSYQELQFDDVERDRGNAAYSP